MTKRVILLVVLCTLVASVGSALTDAEIRVIIDNETDDVRDDLEREIERLRFETEDLRETVADYDERIELGEVAFWIVIIQIVVSLILTLGALIEM